MPPDFSIRSFIRCRLAARARNGELPSGMESLLWYYAKGRPSDDAVSFEQLLSFVRYVTALFLDVVQDTHLRRQFALGLRRKLPIGTDAVQVAARPAGAKPRLLVIVVGETARAQNWGLDGYARDTTPELRQAGVINFTDTSSSGTATEVSLPCMFSPWGRHD